MENAKVPQPNNDGGILSSISNAMDANATDPLASAPSATPATPAPSAPSASPVKAPAGADKAGTSSLGSSITNMVPTVNTEESIKNVKEAFANITNTNENIFYLIAGVFLLALIIAYFLYYVITDNILYQQKIDVPGTEVPIICNELSEFKNSKTMANSNGIKRTYGFWIYINDINKYKGKYRHIAHIGDTARKIKNACPYIFLDNHNNSIHVRFAPLEDTITDTAVHRLNAIESKDTLFNYSSGSGNGKCGITINYIPTQRWVHVVIVVSDVNGGIVYTYIDGELTQQENTKLTLHELNFETKDSTLFVGGSASNTEVDAMGFSGLLSKFSLYNYDLNKNDIYKEYNKGPLNGLLTSMGIVGYGLRNPVYKLNDVY
jgi:hypothetical protein